MSHNISFNGKGQAEAFTAGAPAWHGLGANVKDAKKWEEAAKLARLTWTISKRQFMNPVTDKPVPVYALLRDDDNRFIASCGEKYTIIQNKDAFAWVDSIIGTGDVRFESAGALGNGEIMWCLGKLNEADFSPVKGDKHEPYLLFTDFRDGRSGIVRVCTTRVVCNNTFNIALREDSTGKTVLKLRHTASVKERMEAAKILVRDVKGQILTINEKLRKLVEKPVKQDHFINIMEKLFPGWTEKGRAQNKAAMVAENFRINDNDKIPGIKGTAYGLLNAVTRYIDHQRDGLKTDGQPELLAVRRAESAMFGTGDIFKTDALDTIMDVMGLNPEPELVTVGAGVDVNNVLAKMNMNLSGIN